MAHRSVIVFAAEVVRGEQSRSRRPDRVVDREQLQHEFDRLLRHLDDADRGNFRRATAKLATDSIVEGVIADFCVNRRWVRFAPERQFAASQHAVEGHAEGPYIHPPSP